MINFIVALCSQAMLAQDGRLESEYKLDIPKEDVNSLWSFIQNRFGKDSIKVKDQQLNGSQSIETFVDTYFDNEEGLLAEEEVSFRYRKRFKDGILLKQLVQLKTPYSTDKVVRNELKFKVIKAKPEKQVYAGHPLLKLLSQEDRDKAQYHLSAYRLRLETLKVSLKLKQKRSRIYIKDFSGQSIATITLDEVSNFSFPFQNYAELELELNEVRYTSSNQEERNKMTRLNDDIKRVLAENFPDLSVDQRSKYRKMKMLKDEKTLVNNLDASIWIAYSAFIFYALFLFIKDFSS